jgi:hypothetical protein
MQRSRNSSSETALRNAPEFVKKSSEDRDGNSATGDYLTQQPKVVYFANNIDARPENEEIAMSFNGVGRFSLAPQESIEIFGRFPNGEDLGAQYFSANPTFDTAGFFLVMSQQSKIRNADGTVSYAVTVFNNDTSQQGQENPIPIFFDMQGAASSTDLTGLARSPLPVARRWSWTDGVFRAGQISAPSIFPPIQPRMAGNW